MLYRIMLCVVILVVAACAPQERQNIPSKEKSVSKEEPKPTENIVDVTSSPKCADQNRNKKALFGDLHVHTSYSFDAYAYGVQTTPEDAYRFAKGESIDFLPIDDDGKMSSSIQIDRPLDFVAVTDHAEFLGEQELCTNETSASYNHEYCKTFRAAGLNAMISTGTALATNPSERISPVCPPNDPACLAASQTPWKKIIAAAEQANDASPDCEFTAFVGYEYSGAPSSSNYHRNVIFRNAIVPEIPVSIFEAPLDYDLWLALNKTCTDQMGCEYLTIPHNTNLSNGRLLTPYADLETTEENKLAYAKQRLSREPLVELFQHKGSSECANGFPGILGAPDELCNLEQIRTIGKPGKTGRVIVTDGEVSYTPESSNPTVYCEEQEIGFGGMQNNGCVSKNDFYRTALLTGLQEQNKIGLNPVKLGASASTDSHMSTPGAVKESTWRGHIHTEWNKQGRLLSPTLIPSGKEGNPGGLTGVWAHENSRGAIFDSLLKREVFGTSGPRIKPRFFASWSYPENLCADQNMLETAYKTGVPMGSDLPSAPTTDSAPHFLLAALADPASDATPLQKIQIIKGWIDADGVAHNQVFDVAGDAESTAGVNLETGKRFGEGHSSLCKVFKDPAFDPTENAYYYMRAVENPSPRWSLLDCVAYSDEERPDVCNNPKIASAIQEQAWTSPIWYTPQSTGANEQ